MLKMMKYSANNQNIDHSLGTNIKYQSLMIGNQALHLSEDEISNDNVNLTINPRTVLVGV